MKFVLLLLLVFPAMVLCQPSKQDSVWRPFLTFIGNWEGTGGGEPGIGKYKRSYGYALARRFIEVRNKSVYPPTERHPNGEVHEDIGYISYDKMRRKFVLRQFHVEGFVNQYVLDSVSVDGKTMIFVSEGIENIPAGWRARETYHIDSANSITEAFDLAPPGKPFEPYTKVTLNRTE